MTHLTYSDGVYRKARALAHASALRALSPLYTQALCRAERQHPGAPSSAAFHEALDTIDAAVRALDIADFQACMPSEEFIICPYT